MNVLPLGKDHPAICVQSQPPLCISGICIKQKGLFFGMVPLFSVWSQSAHGEASHEKVTGGNTCTRNHQGLQEKKKVLFALFQGSGCSCFDVEQFLCPETHSAMQLCVYVTSKGCTRVHVREHAYEHVCVHVCEHVCVHTSGAHSRGRAAMEMWWQCTGGVGACTWSLCGGRWISPGMRGAGPPPPPQAPAGAARRGAAPHGTARPGLCVFLHTPHVTASVQPRSPPSRQQMFGAERASTRPTFHAGRETPSSAKGRTKLPPR